MTYGEKSDPFHFLNLDFELFNNPVLKCKFVKQLAVMLRSSRDDCYVLM